MNRQEAYRSHLERIKTYLEKTEGKEIVDTGRTDYFKKYYQKNREKIREYHRKYYQENREKIMERKKRWVEEKKK